MKQLKFLLTLLLMAVGVNTWAQWETGVYSISPSSTNTSLYITTTTKNSSEGTTTYTLQETMEKFRFISDGSGNWKIKSTSTGRWLGPYQNTLSGAGFWNTKDSEYAWVITKTSTEGVYHIYRQGNDNKGLGWDRTGTGDDNGVYSDKSLDETNNAYDTWIIREENDVPVSNTLTRTDDQRHTEYIQLNAGDRGYQTIGNLQTASDATPARRDIYFNFTGSNDPAKKFYCKAGEALVMTSDIEHSMNAMQCYVYIDENKNGFEYNSSAPNSNPTQSLAACPDLKAFGGYNYGSDNWLNSTGGTAEHIGTGGNKRFMRTPAFTAPSEPGTYRLRYKVQWNNIDPVSTIGMQQDAGIIVDVDLVVVEELSSYNITYNIVNVSEKTREQAISASHPQEAMQIVIYDWYAEPNKGYYNATMTAEGNNVTVNITQNLPFETSTLGDDEHAHWYAVSIHGSDHNFLYYDSTNAHDDLHLNTGTYNEAADYNVWAFCGNIIDGFEIYNKAAGWDLSVSSVDPTSTTGTGQDALPQLDSEHPTKWKVYKSTHKAYQRTSGTGKEQTKPGFFLGYETDGAKLNRRDNNLAYWTEGADDGSTFDVCEPWDAFVMHNNVATEAALTAIKNASDDIVGSEIGKYSRDLVNKAKNMDLTIALSATAANTYDGQVEQINNILAVVSPNLPKKNTFYRIKNGGNYLQASDDQSDGAAYTLIDNGTEKQTIWFYNESGQFISYNLGKGFNETYKQSSVTSPNNRFTFKTEHLSRPDLAIVAAISSNSAKYLMVNGNSLAAGTLSSTTSDADKAKYAWQFEEVTDVPVTISSYGYATLYLPMDVNIPNDNENQVEAWYSTSLNDGSVNLYKITDNVLPANTPVILKGNEGTYTFTIRTNADTPTTTSEGELSEETDETEDEATTPEAPFKGTFASTNVRAAEALHNCNRILTLGVDNGTASLYAYGKDNKDRVLSGFKMYMPYNYVEDETGSGSSAPRLSWNDIETAIEAIHNTDMQTSVMYNLNGQQVMKEHGLVIVNGRKYIIK